MKDLKADLEKRERQHFEAKRREAAAAAGVAGASWVERRDWGRWSVLVGVCAFVCWSDVMMRTGARCDVYMCGCGGTSAECQGAWFLTTRGGVCGGCGWWRWGGAQTVLEDSALRAIANGETGSGGGLETKEDEDIMAAVADFDDSDADDSESRCVPCVVLFRRCYGAVVGCVPRARRHDDTADMPSLHSQ